jgi:hypothetical protein
MRRAGGASDDATGGNDGGRANATAMGLMPGFARARANKAFQGSGKAVGISAPANADANNDIGYGDKAAHDKKEHDNNATYDDVSQAASCWGRHRRN